MNVVFVVLRTSGLDRAAQCAALATYDTATAWLEANAVPGSYYVIEKRWTR